MLLSAAALFAGLSPSTMRAEEGSHALALIDVAMQGDSIEIVGSALALTSGQFSGEMTISRKGASGTVSTRQGRELDLAAGAKADIARVSVSHQTGDLLSVTLTLSRDGAVIARSTLSAP